MLGLFNVIIISISIHILLGILGFKQSGILSCGLFGYISVKDNHNFNWDKFNHLGLDNDERGGDSIGRMVGDEIIKYVNNKKAKTTYQEYVINYKNGTPSHIAMGHTRKASVGVISEKTAQPVELELPAGGKFVMVHNGTIYNWEDLAKKHNIDYVGKTDSMVMAEIIAYQGFDVLTEYEGAAAIIIRDDRDPDTLKLFKGASKNYSGKVDEERPLYIYQESPSSMYVSSKEDGLYFIGGDADSVMDLEPNTLYTIYGGRIISSEKYDRSNCSSVKKVFTSANTTGFYSTNKRQYSGYGYEDYDSFDEYYEANRKPENPPKTTLRTDIIPTYNNVNKIVQAKLRYYFKKTAMDAYYANGAIVLNEEGEVYTKNSKTPGKKYYFYSGIMIKDFESYKKVKEIFGKARHFIDTDDNIKKICEYSVYPVGTIDANLPNYGNARQWKTVWNSFAKRDEYNAVWATGEFKPVFSYKIYHLTCGELTEVKFDSTYRLADHSNVDQITFEEKRIELLPAIMTVVKTTIEDTKNKLNVRDFTNDIDDLTEEDIFYDTDDDDDDDFADDDLNDDYIKKAIHQGADNILKAVDEIISELEQLGVSGKIIQTTLSNFYKIQDAFIDMHEFKKKPLIVSYEQF